MAWNQQQCIEDMQIQDKIQGEMLRTLLKRLIINLTRIAKQQTGNYREQGADRMDIIRKFNLLLEIHFRTRHEVQFYAQTMNRSPKTLTNLFGALQLSLSLRADPATDHSRSKTLSLFHRQIGQRGGRRPGFHQLGAFQQILQVGTGMNFSESKVLV